MCNKDYNYKEGVPYKVIADHVRMLVFAIADGAMPGNEGRGYVLRRVLRRAARFGRMLELKEPFLYRLAATLVQVMGEAFPEVKEKQKHIEKLKLFKNRAIQSMNFIKFLKKIKSFLGIANSF